jgi:hypothetical protein
MMPAPLSASAARLDHVRAKTPDERVPLCPGRDERTSGASKVLRAENRGKRIEPGLEARAPVDRACKVLRACLARSLFQRIGPHAGQIELLVRQWHGPYGSQVKKVWEEDYRGSGSGGVVEDYPQRVSMARAQPAHAMPHVDPVDTP